MHETSARAWCTGKTQRDRVEREAGGGIGMGNTCKSMADSCQCAMTKPLQYCKVISLQLIKINREKKVSDPALELWSLKCVFKCVCACACSVAPALWDATDCPWDFWSKNSEVGCHFLLQGVFQQRDPTRVSSIGRWIFFLPLCHLESPSFQVVLIYFKAKQDLTHLNKH